LIVHGVNYVGQTKIHTAEPIMSNAFKIEMTFEKIRRPKLPGTDQIPAEFVKAGSRTL
jgi:hypothetical protein